MHMCSCIVGIQLVKSQTVFFMFNFGNIFLKEEPRSGRTSDHDEDGGIRTLF